VWPKNVWLWCEESNTEDGITETVKESEVGLILEPPDVDVRVDGEPGAIDFRKETNHAVALNVTKLLHLEQKSVSR
jgi:hypothetical protein